MSRISQTFARLNGAKALIPYITAGDPAPDTTLHLMHALADAGADIIELGVPFSDPMADGPVIQRAADGCSFVCVAASGGARMQEGLNSLMQMTKTSASLHLLSEKGLPFISVLTDPTMGGVSASFAFLGDIVLAEPNALIGFAGPRVIEQTVRETLPEGFQRAEFLLEKGAIDQITDRREMKARIAELITLLRREPAAA